MNVQPVKSVKPAVTRALDRKSIKAYSPNIKDTLVRRGAHFLDWAAKHFPRQFIPYNLAYAAVMGIDRMPILSSREVETFRGTTARIRKVLIGEYGRELVTMPGTGFRATVDSTDVLKQQVPRRVGAFIRAKESLKATAGLVNTTEVPDTEELKPLKRWFSRSLGDALKVLNSAEFEAKLALPKGEEK